MIDQASAITERMLDFAAGAIKLVGRLEKTSAGRYLSNQLMRASASAGANYQEARGAESRADFVHKLQIALKELREAAYWLKLIARAELLSMGELTGLLAEADALTRMVARSVLTAKSNQLRPEDGPK